VYSSTGLFWRKCSLSECTVLYFSDLKWCREHFEATIYKYGSKKKFTSPTIWMPNSLKFQCSWYIQHSACVCPSLWFKAYAEGALLWQFSTVINLECWSYLEVQRVIRGHRKCWQLTFTNSSLAYRLCNAPGWQRPTVHDTEGLVSAAEVWSGNSRLSPYSPNLTASDFHLFRTLKEHSSGYHFTFHTGVRHHTIMWLTKQQHMISTNLSHAAVRSTPTINKTMSVTPSLKLPVSSINNLPWLIECKLTFWSTFISCN
jgi:hypothetical protein